MDSYDDLPADLQEAIQFHGHLCPGLVSGYVAARECLQRLGVERAEDEELVAIVENDACGVDAVQVLTGCTFGKGNFIFHDFGKHVYTIARRSDGRGVRASARPRRRGGSHEAAKEQRARQLLDVSPDDLFDFHEGAIDLPPKARLHDSAPCDLCGEPTMMTRLRERDDRRLCIPCSLTQG